MAFPKTSRLRQIVVNDAVYRWRFQGGELHGTLFIYGPQSGGTPLQIHSKHWFDLWLSYPFWLQEAPVIVTPALVREAVLWALNQGWNPTQRGATRFREWKNGKFQTEKIWL